MIERIKKYLKVNSLCRMKFHDWTISRLVNKNGKLVNHIRTCEVCEKEQYLKRTTRYHPTKYIWADKIIQT